MTAGSTPFERYAVYAAPPADSPLGRFGAAWLGWDAEARRPAPRLAIDGLPEPIETLTENAARYGFHGTLKAPFRLAPNLSRAALEAAVSDLAEDAEAVDLPPLALSNQHGFVALRPTAPCPALSALAEECVRSLDAFRAPLTEAERAKRRAAGLSPAQEANLERWGYPYVGEDFHFHLTLTKRQSPEAADRAIAALEPHLAPILTERWKLSDLCLFGDPGDGAPFAILKRAALLG